MGKWLKAVITTAVILASAPGMSSPAYGHVIPGSGGPGPGSHATGIAPLGSSSGVTGGALFGGTASLVKDTPQLGRQLAIVRVYYRLGDTFPSPADQALMAAGSTLLVSLDTEPGIASYAAIAAGTQDASISAFLNAVSQAAVQNNLASIYISFEHEMNAAPNAVLGTPAQFIAAWDHVRHLAAAAHLNWRQGGRLHWVFIMTNWAYKQPLTTAAFWPGASKVDIAAADGYNSNGCKHPNGTFTADRLFGPVVSFAAANGGLPVFIAEWGVTPLNPFGGQAGFISQMQAFISANPAVAAEMYWDHMGRRCTFSIDASPSALAAMAAMGQAAALQGHL